MILLRHTLIVIFATLLLVLSIYLVVAYQKKLWPFKPKKPTTPSNAMMSQTRGGNDEHTKLGVGAIIVIVLFIILFGVLMVIGIRLTIMRYQIAGEAIKQGNTGVALGALAPEIGSGIGSIFHGSNY